MAQPLSPERLTYGFQAAADPRVSPDGLRILHVVGRTDRAAGKAISHLWIRGFDGSDPRQITFAGERNGYPRWSPDGSQIAFVSDRVAKNGLFVVDLDRAGEPRELVRHEGSISEPAWSPDGTRIAYLVPIDPANPAETPRPSDAPPPVRVTRRIDYKQDNRGYLGDTRLQMFVVDVATGDRWRVTRDLVDHTSPSWSPDGRTIAVKIGRLNGVCSQLAIYPVAGGEPAVVGPEKGSIAIWSWSPDGGRILFAGEQERSIQPDFFLHTLGTGAIDRLTTDLDCTPDAGFPTVLSPTRPIWIDRDRALFSAVRAGASQLAVIDTTTGAIETIARWEGLNAGLTADRSASRFALAHSSLKATGEIATFERGSDEQRVVTSYSAPTFAESPPALAEHYQIERAGLPIDVWLLKPPDFDPTKRYPVILDVHGGPNGHYGYGFNAVQQCLATNGFLVVYSNPRGSSSYGRDFAAKVLRDWGGEDYWDLLAVVDSVTSRPYADPARVGIWGYSYGGYMTAWAIGQSDRFQAAVCGAPCFDLQSLYGTSDIAHEFGEFNWGGPPHEHAHWYRERSPITWAHRARTPTLIIHGEADQRCPIGQGEQMFISLLKAGCEVEFVRYPGASHALLRTGPAEYRRDALERILRWFRAKLLKSEE